MAQGEGARGALGEKIEGASERERERERERDRKRELKAGLGG